MRDKLFSSCMALAMCLNVALGNVATPPVKGSLLVNKLLQTNLTLINNQIEPPIIRIVCDLGMTNDHGTSDLRNYDLSEINQRLCTHVIVPYITIDNNGDIKIANANDDQIVNLNSQLRSLKQRGIKILWTWGNWDGTINHLNPILRNAETRQALIKNLLNWIKINDLDGLNLDWAFGQILPLDYATQSSLLKDLRSAFNKKGLLLTMSMSDNLNVIRKMYQIPRIIRYLDMALMWVMDLNNNPNRTSLFAPLYSNAKPETQLSSIDDQVQLYLKIGIPADKLIIGISTAGRNYTLANPLKTTPGCPIIGSPQLIPYNKLCILLLNNNWSLRFEPLRRGDYAFKDNQWISYHSVRLIRDVTEYAERWRLGGIIIWGLNRDDDKGLCGYRWPLLKTISAGLKKRRDPVITWNPVPKKPSPPLFTPSKKFKPVGYIKCNELGFAADITNASRFYRCQLDIKHQIMVIHMMCPSNLIFNTKLNICDWPKKP